jgi:GNAT superfamily N-acetyltransferase
MVRPVQRLDQQHLSELQLLLWPDFDGITEPGEETLVWEQNGSLGGFITYSLRPSANGCDERPVPFVEGWFVRENLRRQGIGRALLLAVENLFRSKGHRELGSDTLLENRLSRTVHRRLGFEPTEQVQYFRKKLSPSHDRAAQLFIRTFSGDRNQLRNLFREADDSDAQIDRYLHEGTVFVAVEAEHIIGHVQLVRQADFAELKSIAVAQSHRGRGIGRKLAIQAMKQAHMSGALTLLVATATADIGNLRFYQSLGFRMERIERDAFRSQDGYPLKTEDNLPLRDRVWLSLDFAASQPPL